MNKPLYTIYHTSILEAPIVAHVYYHLSKETFDTTQVHLVNIRMQIEEKYTEYKIDSKIIQQPPKNEKETKFFKSIHNIIKQDGFIQYTIEKKDMSTGGGNYLGELKEVNVKGLTVDGYKELNIFVKVIIPDDNSSVISLEEAYRREKFFYNNISKIFEELQDEADIPLEDRFKTVKYYDESNVDALYMENMSKKGYKTMYRMDVATLSFAELTIEQMAKFHALGFAIERKRPDYFKRLIRTLKTSFLFDERKEVFNSFASKIYEYISPCFNEEDKQKVQNFLNNSREIFSNILGEDQSITNCLCHGDFRANNMLIKEEVSTLSEFVIFIYK